MVKALALHSGGLDSTLAIRLIQEQKIAVEAIHFVSVFDCGATEEESCASSRRSGARLGIKTHYEDFSEDLLRLVKNPPHGHGSNMNPCIDCHARMMMRAASRMAEIGADFLISGEVVGERPMSQRREALRIVEREAGVEGRLLRPLSALLLDPTVPEQKGWVDREGLLDISGRSRKRQFELARAFGITDYPSPAGGCLLTEPGFAARLRELLKDDPDCTVADARLLKVGRHFRLAPRIKAVVGRNEAENGRLLSLAAPEDFLIDADDVPGPTALVRGPATDENLQTAASITLRYGKAASRPTCPVHVVRRSDGLDIHLDAAPGEEALLSLLRIGMEESGGGRRVGE